jgi:hypothetical protein
MSHRFGAKPAQTRVLFRATLIAGGGWTSAPPGWGRAREHSAEVIGR